MATNIITIQTEVTPVLDGDPQCCMLFLRNGNVDMTSLLILSKFPNVTCLRKGYISCHQTVIVFLPPCCLSQSLISHVEYRNANFVLLVLGAIVYTRSLVALVVVIGTRLGRYTSSCSPFHTHYYGLPSDLHNLGWTFLQSIVPVVVPCTLTIT